MTLLTATAWGRCVGLDVAVAGAAVHAWLPHWWDLDAPPVEPERVWRIGSAGAAESAVAALELWVAEHAEGLIFVHAGVVVVDGLALLLPGRSMTGKSTLTAALVRSGAVFGSDEYAPIDATGRVHPYPRPLRTRGPAGRVRMPIDELGGTNLDAPVAVGGVAMLRFVEGGRWDTTPMTPAQAVLGLVDNCVAARSRPAEMLEALVAAAPPERLVTGVRGEPDEAVGALLAMLRH